MGYDEHKASSPTDIGTAVLIISDSRTTASDESGKLICRRLQENQHRVIRFDLITNDAVKIKDLIGQMTMDERIKVVITSGGTGLSLRDVTIETVTPFMSKQMHGFGELFRNLSYQEIGAGCIMSRAHAGVVNNKVVICLPGSLKAVTLALEKIILPEIGHMVREASR